MRRGMAFLACDPRVLFHQGVSGQPMVELLNGRVPVDQRKILAIVFEVAAHAILAIGILHPQLRVIALFCRQAVCDFLVAFQAFEGWRAGAELVAGVALGRAVERLVGFGKRSGRNLCASAGRSEQNSANRQQHTK